MFPTFVVTMISIYHGALGVVVVAMCVVVFFVFHPTQKDKNRFASGV